MSFLRWQTTFDPFRDLRALQDRMSTILEDSPLAPDASTFPPIDIRRDADAVHVTAEVPGVALDGIQITVLGDTLTLEGERKGPAVEAERYHRRERRAGKFKRVVTLPDRVDADRIEATLKDGILRIHLPKAESAKPRTIKVAQG